MQSDASFAILVLSPLQTAVRVRTRWDGWNGKASVAAIQSHSLDKLLVRAHSYTPALAVWGGPMASSSACEYRRSTTAF